VSETDSSGRRFFLCHRRRAPADARLARRLVDALRAAGHDVFIDVDIPIGADWSAEITRRSLPEENLIRVRGRLRSLRDRWRAGTVSPDEVRQRLGAWIAHARHADTVRLRHRLFQDELFHGVFSRS
jgi:hypothetical protein